MDLITKWVKGLEIQIRSQSEQEEGVAVGQVVQENQEKRKEEKKKDKEEDKQKVTSKKEKEDDWYNLEVLQEKKCDQGIHPCDKKRIELEKGLQDQRIRYCKYGRVSRVEAIGTQLVIEQI